MDELELLKKDWNTRQDPQVSQDDIYKMLHKKSSSKVKWIFYISLFELLVGVISIAWSLSHPNESFTFEESGTDYSWLPLLYEIVASLVLIYFAYQFYINYKKISTRDNAKKLMTNIINTRKSVKNYIKVCLILGGVFSVVSLFLVSLESPAFKTLFNENNHLVAYLILIAVILVTTVIIIGFVWLVYQLIYGLLLRNLNKNYKEIKKLEV